MAYSYIHACSRNRRVDYERKRMGAKQNNDTLYRCVYRPSFVKIFANAVVFPIRATVRFVNVEWMMHNF